MDWRDRKLLLLIMQLWFTNCKECKRRLIE